MVIAWRVALTLTCEYVEVSATRVKLVNGIMCNNHQLNLLLLVANESDSEYEDPLSTF